jgi:organic radical activating enzyme
LSQELPEILSTVSTSEFRILGPASDPAHRAQLEDFARNPAVMLELSSRCNFHCDYCRSPHSDRQKSTMSRKLFNHVLPQLQGLTQRRLRLHVDGEPMLHPEFLEIGLDANRAGYRLAIASNASALRNDFLALDMDLYVHLSSSPEEHATRSTANYALYLEKIRRYVAGWLASTATQEVELRIFYRVRDRTNEEAMRAKRVFAAEFVAGFGLDAAGCWQAPEWGPDFVCQNQAGKTLRIRFIQTAEGGLFPTISNARNPGDLPPDRGFCDSPWKLLAVHSDGAVGFCCVDVSGKTIFTHPDEIWEKPLSWIWNHHPRLVEARQQFMDGYVKLPICQECLQIAPNRENYLFTELFPGDPRG